MNNFETQVGAKTGREASRVPQRPGAIGSFRSLVGILVPKLDLGTRLAGEVELRRRQVRAMNDLAPSEAQLRGQVRSQVQLGNEGKIAISKSKLPRLGYRVQCRMAGVVTVAGLFASTTAQATTTTWSATPTDSNWVTSASETNWTAGAGIYPGSISGFTSTQTATFSGASTILGITINSTSLNIKNISFTGTAEPAYTIGTTGGNSLFLTSGGSINVTSTVTGANVINAVNAPLVLEPASNTTAGTYTFSNSSGTASHPLQIGGAVTGGTTSAGIALTLGGSNTGNNQVSGAISDGGAAGGVSVSVSGGATWILSGANTYSGATTISAGTLTAGANGAFSSASAVTVGTEADTAVATLNLAGFNETINSLQMSAGASGAQSVVTLGGGTLTVNGTIGYGVSGNNNYPATISGLGALDLGGASRTFNINSENNSSGDLLISSVIKDGGIIKAQTGVLTLSGANTYAGGTTVNNGTVIVNTGGTLGASTGSLAVNAATGVTTALNLNVSQTVNGLSGTIAGTGTATITIASGFTLNSTQTTNTEYDGVITGAGTLTKDGTGTLSVTNTNTYTGGTNINGGTLAINGPNEVGATAGGLNINNGTFELTTINGIGTSYTTARNVTLGNANSAIFIDAGLSLTETTGVLSGTGSLTKTGTGVLGITAASTYMGTTSINAGTLLALNTSGSATSTGAVSVGAAGTLASGAGATGIITGAVTTAMPTSQIAPGATATALTGTVGALTLNGGLNIANGATVLFDLGSTQNNSDLITTSSLTAGVTPGAVTFAFNNTGAVPGTYELIGYTVGTSVLSSDFTATGAIGTFTVVNNQVDFTFVSAVPEPATVLGGALLVGAVGWSQRRRLRALLSRASRGLQAKPAA